jgi:hypothetical protein
MRTSNNQLSDIRQDPSGNQTDPKASGFSAKLRELTLGAALLVAGAGGCSVSQNGQQTQRPDTGSTAVPTERTESNAREIRTNDPVQDNAPTIRLKEELATPFTLAEFRAADGTWIHGFSGAYTEPGFTKGNVALNFPNRRTEREETVFLAILKNIDSLTSLTEATDAALKTFPDGTKEMTTSDVERIAKAGGRITDCILVVGVGPNAFYLFSPSGVAVSKVVANESGTLPDGQKTITFDEIQAMAEKSNKKLLFVVGKILKDEERTF